ncbi:MAG TPA: extracellular solute-binding protein [Terrimesophilobacter sp.]|uniref:extracellular solute-binding protein n=1 Tax=Terrimesophilobacter sp. TaxID=2906435 RepID=UPI002F9347DF
MNKKFASLAGLAMASALVLAGCSAGEPGTGGDGASTDGKGKTITLWLNGADTPDALRTYLIDEFKKETGGTLKIEQQDWTGLVPKLTTALPDANNTPDVVEVGNTQSPTFTNVGAFLDISDMYKELGGSDLLQSFVDVGVVDGKNYTLPYYFGSRYVFYRKDVWKEAGVEVPKTLDEFNAAVAKIAEANPRGIANFSGLFIGGQDWRNGISWVFANGGDLAKLKDGKWESTLSDPNTIKGLEQLQKIDETANKAPADAKDQSPWLYINDSDVATNDDKSTTPTTLASATIMAPAWAHWSIGDLSQKDGKPVRTWNDNTFGVFALPGNDGKPAPVFAGGSNIGISAKSKNPGLAKTLLKIIFSADFQEQLGKNGLGPANTKYFSSLGTDEFAQALIESASNSKLTPAAPGWATVEGKQILEEFFSKIAQGGDVASLAQEYDAKITPLLNLKG